MWPVKIVHDNVSSGPLYIHVSSFQFRPWLRPTSSGPEESIDLERVRMRLISLSFFFRRRKALSQHHTTLVSCAIIRNSSGRKREKRESLKLSFSHSQVFGYLVAWHLIKLCWDRLSVQICENQNCAHTGENDILHMCPTPLDPQDEKRL